MSADIITCGQRLLRFIGVASFFVFLGWTIPYMIIVPFLRVGETFSMLSSGTPSLLGPDLTTMVPCAIAVYYVLFGKSVGEFWSKFPWFGPFVLVAFTASLGTTLMAHLAYIATAHKLESVSVSLTVLAAFLTWRCMVIFLAFLRPLDRFVVLASYH
jgi:hypothetical protein